MELSYRAGGRAGGADFGSILIRTTASDDCSLKGTLTITPIDDQAALLGTVLPLHALARNTIIAPTFGRAEIIVGGSLRTSDGLDLCPTSEIVTPRSWRLNGAIEATVSNQDPTPARPGLSACAEGGRLHMLTPKIVPAG